MDENVICMTSGVLTSSCFCYWLINLILEMHEAFRSANLKEAAKSRTNWN
jgi:hypothetical protein